MAKDCRSQTESNYKLPTTNYQLQYTIYDRLIEFCLVFLIVFTPFAYGAVQPWSIAVFEITTAFMALLWIFKMFSSGKFEFTSNPLTLFIFLFITYIFLQFIIHRSLPTTYYLLPTTIYPWATKTELLKIVSYALIFFVTLNTIRTKKQIIRIMSAIIAVGFVMSIFFLMRYFGARAPRGIVNYDHFSGYLGMVIPLTVGFLLIRNIPRQASLTFVRDRRDLSPRDPERRRGAEYGIRNTTHGIRPLLFFSVITMSAALFFTMSRGGMLSFIAALLVMAGLVLNRKSIKKRGWILSAIVIFIILVIAWLDATPVIEQILSMKVEITSLYFGGRFPIWQGTLNIIKDYPIFGTGLGTFNYIFPKYQPAQIIAKHYTYAHSDILEFISEVGIIVFFVSMVYGLWSMVYLFKRFRTRHDPWVIGMSIGIFGSLASIFVHSFADFNLHIPANAILLIVTLSLFITVLNVVHSPQSTVHGLRTDSRKPIIYYLGYPVTLAMISFYIFTAAKPALADYYARFSTIAGLKQAIVLDPSNAAYHHQLGKLYNKLSSINHRLSAYKKAVELNPTNAKYHQSLAWTYGQLHDLLNLSPILVRRSLGEGGTYHLSPADCVKLSHKHLQEAIRFEPENLHRHHTYAIWLFNHPTKENIEKGVAAYRKVIEYKPELAKEALKKYSIVEKSYKELKKILSDIPENHYKVMNMLLEAGLWEQNEADFKEDMEKAAYKYPYYKAISEYYARNRDIKKSIQVLEDYLNIDPYCADAHFWIADRSFYSKDYDWEFSEAHHRKTIELEPENLSYKYWYAVHLAYKGQYAKADKIFNEILTVNPDYTDKIRKFKSEHFKNQKWQIS